MIGRLNHVAIAVPDLEAAAAQYRRRQQERDAMIPACIVVAEHTRTVR